MKKKLCPTDPAFWTPERRKQHSERLEEFYEAAENESFENYAKVTTGK